MIAEFTITAGPLGDSILPEPALYTLGVRRGSPVHVHVRNPEARVLYAKHPVIRLVDEEGGVNLDASDAFWWGIRHNTYFGAGYFPQVGIQPEPADRLHYKPHWLASGPTYDMVVLCPFSRSCDVHKTGKANKTVPVSWWTDVLRQAAPSLPVVSLGSREDPEVPGTLNLRGAPLELAAMLALRARLLITVETFFNILAGGKENGRTLFMSAAVPIWFVAPPGAEIVRNENPALWSVPETVSKINSMMP